MNISEVLHGGADARAKKVVQAFINKMFDDVSATQLISIPRQLAIGDIEAEADEYGVAEFVLPPFEYSNGYMREWTVAGEMRCFEAENVDGTECPMAAGIVKDFILQRDKVWMRLHSGKVNQQSADPDN
ncbi:hypothetical protein [Maricaulis sp.]|uniref:hypothetical protein n=1 Tax=Maricaulis sp. TaxID=1486257 RepID=UPI003A8DFE24